MSATATATTPLQASAPPAAAPVPAALAGTVPELPVRRGDTTLATLIDLYMAHYTGRDTTLPSRLALWRGRLGGVTLQELDDDQVAAVLDSMSARAGRYYAGKDADGQPIFRIRRKNQPLSPATVNRYLASLSGVITWAIKRRIAPKGYVHPCRAVEKRAENNERTRFLSDTEREALLQACKAAKWPKLYLLVLMALTTGARLGEMTGLRWRDLDLQRGQATVHRTKNGDPRLLVLTPAVVEELRRFEGAPGALVFGAKPRGEGRKEAVFSWRPHFEQACKEAKVREFTFHCLRHSCASMLAQRGRTLLEIADMLGHRQLQVTKRYSHLATSHKAAMAMDVFGDVR